MKPKVDYGGKFVTINTDASFREMNGIKEAGYAYWIVHNAFKIKNYGGFNKRAPFCNNEAELMAIGNAFKALQGIATPPPEVEVIVINTDSLYCHHRIESQDTELAKLVVNIINTTLKHFNNAKLKLKHVRAHTGKRDGRSYVNDWCDKMAKASRIQCSPKKIDTPHIKQTNSHGTKTIKTS